MLESREGQEAFSERREEVPKDEDIEHLDHPACFAESEHCESLIRRQSVALWNFNQVLLLGVGFLLRLRSRALSRYRLQLIKQNKLMHVCLCVLCGSHERGK